MPLHLNSLPSRQFSNQCIDHRGITCNCGHNYARIHPSNDCIVYPCTNCANKHFNAIEHKNKIDLMPVRFDKLEEHTNHIESKVNALEIEINEISKTTKKYSEESSKDINILNSRIDMLNEQLKNTNSRIDEIYLVFTNIKNMFTRYNNIVDLVEKQLGLSQLQEITDGIPLINK